MLRRYLFPTALIMIVSLGVAGAAYAASSTTRFSSTCVFQVVIHLSRSAPQTPDNQEFIGTLALQEVGTAIASGVYTRVAQSQKVDPAELQRSVFTRATPGLGAFLVTMFDPDRRRAIRLANATCDEFVTSITSQRSKEIAAQVKNVENRITSIQAEVKRLEAIPASKRTATQIASLQGQRAALQFNSGVIANIISLPPDDISVLTRASGAIKTQTGSLRKNLIIALVAGLLACFLYILVGEVITERRQGSTPIPS